VEGFLCQDKITLGYLIVKGEVGALAWEYCHASSICQPRQGYRV